MEINVIIPVKNRETILPETLASVGAQIRRPDRIIIVDNASTDGTADVARRWAAANPDLRVDIISCPTPGASAARNAGMALVESRPDIFVAFFDSDDIMLPDHLRRIAAELTRRPDVDLLYFDLALRDREGWTTVKSVAGDAPLIRSHIFHAVLSTTRYVASADLIRRAGPWDETLPRWNDYEMGLRLAVNARKPLKLCGEPTVIGIPRPDSITGTTFSADAPTLIAALDAMRRTLAEASLAQDLRYLRARRAILAALFARERRPDLADTLLKDTLASAPSRRDRLAITLAYLATRLTGRGGSIIASTLLAPKRPGQSAATSRLRRP